MATDCKTRARFLSFSSSLGPTHPPSRRVPGFFHTTVMLMAHLQLQPNLRRYTSTPTYVFRERRLIKLRDNFTFYPQTWYLFPSTVCGSSKPLKRRARACVYVYVCVCIYTHKATVSLVPEEAPRHVMNNAQRKLPQKGKIYDCIYTF